MDKLELKIGNTTLNVRWEENDSVKELIKYAKDGLSIPMHKYGGFEQVGSIGHTLPSNDFSMTTSAGDIVLYSSNQIVIFYDSNTWEYTKLGQIDLSKIELKELLDKENITIILNVK